MSQTNLNPNKRNTSNLNSNLNVNRNSNLKNFNNFKNQKNNGSMSGYSSTTTNTSSTTGFSAKSVIGIVLVVVIIIILLGVSYWAYNYYTNMQVHTYVNTEVLTDVKDASSKFSVGSGTIPNSKFSNEYSISMWLNIADYSYNYGKEKVILRRGEAGPEIVLDSKNNDLIVRVKLQGASANSAMGSKSAFANVEDSIQTITIPTKQLQTHQYGMNEPGDKAYIRGKFDLEGTTDIMMVPCEINTVFDKVSGNKVNYPTVQYVMTSGCDNALNTHLPADAMTIMIEQTKRMKEGFTDVSMNKLSDNSAPPETQVLHESFYSAISGGASESMIERFDVTSDYVDASAAVMLDLCKIFSELEKQSTADDSIAIMNSFFQGMLDILAAGKKSLKTSEEINNEIMKSAEDKADADILTIMKDSKSIAQFSTLLEKLHTNSEILMNMEESMTTKPDFTTYQNAVNAKLIAANCKLTFDGATEFDATISFYENIIKQIKKSLYTYIANLGVSIQKSNPNIVDKQAACLVDSVTNQDPTVGTCIARMIPLQRWVNVIVSIYNQIIDIYVDGQLASSCVIKGFPAISTANVDITPDGGFSGQISRVSFSNTAMTVQRAKEIYYDGPVASDSIFSMIPTWAYYLTAFIIIALIIGSFFM
jgi:hypothetical protein